jgi:RecB family endonuclease NucS
VASNVKTVRNGQYGPATMRLFVARCEVHYTGRLTAVLPEAVRLLVFKADGSVLVHDDAGGYKPLNCTRKEFRPRERS